MNSWNQKIAKWQASRKDYQSQQKEWKKDDINQCCQEACSTMDKIITLKNSQQEKHREKVKAYFKHCREWNSWTVEELESRYQTLIKGFSLAYLEVTEWYMGPTLINNKDFVYPYYVWTSDYPKWCRSLWVVHILTMSDYPILETD